MPVISMFYGIIVRMFHFDDRDTAYRTYMWNIREKWP